MVDSRYVNSFLYIYTHTLSPQPDTSMAGALCTNSLPWIDGCQLRLFSTCWTSHFYGKTTGRFFACWLVTIYVGVCLRMVENGMYIYIYTYSHFYIHNYIYNYIYINSPNGICLAKMMISEKHMRIYIYIICSCFKLCSAKNLRIAMNSEALLVDRGHADQSILFRALKAPRKGPWSPWSPWCKTNLFTQIAWSSSNFMVFRWYLGI